MKQLARMICKTILEKNRGGVEPFFSFVSKTVKAQWESVPKAPEGMNLRFHLTKEIIPWVHVSWLEPFLRSFSETEVCLFLSCLPNDKAQLLQDSLKISKPLFTPSGFIKSFFQKQIANFLLPSNLELYPLSALSGCAMHSLLEISEKEMALVIDLLGLHDLAVELKQIIDNTKLKQIYGLFPAEKQAYLKRLIHKNETVIFKKIEISRWDGNVETLIPILHQRGINRLAKGLYSEDPSLIWYVKHRIKKDDADLFSSLFTKLKHTKAHEFLEKQVLEASTFVQSIRPKEAL